MRLFQSPDNGLWSNGVKLACIGAEVHNPFSSTIVSKIMNYSPVMEDTAVFNTWIN